MKFFSEFGQVSVAWRKNSSQPTGGVISTPTNTARTELHSMITFHHANTRGSRAAKLRIVHLCVPKTIDIQVSCLVLCDHKHKFSLTHFIHLSNLSDGVSFTNKPYDSRPICTLRWPTAEWRINTNQICHITEVQRQSRREMNIVHVPTKDRKRLNDKLDPKIRQYLEWFSEKWEQYFTKERELPTSSSSFQLSSTSWWSSHEWSSTWKGWQQHSWQDDKWSDQR